MANALYDAGRQNFLEGNIAWLTDDIRLVSIDEGDDAVDLVNDNALDDILVGAREFESGNFAGKTSTDGTADASDLTPAFAAAVGDEFESISLFLESGVESTSLLICNIDTASGLPLTPDGSNIEVLWSGGADRIFTL